MLVNGDFRGPSSTWPLVKVLGLVHGFLKHVMGYAFEAIDRTKEQIQNNFDRQAKRGKRVSDIVDQR